MKNDFGQAASSVHAPSAGRRLPGSRGAPLCCGGRGGLAMSPRRLSTGLLTAPDVAVAGPTCCVFRPPLNSATFELCESPSARILLNGKTRGIWPDAFKESTSVELLPIEAVCPGLNPSCVGTRLGCLLTHPARHGKGVQIADVHPVPSALLAHGFFTVNDLTIRSRSAQFGRSSLGSSPRSCRPERMACKRRRSSAGGSNESALSRSARAFEKSPRAA
jgi:hypothetical protein